MSDVKVLFDAGRLQEAVEELIREVKANPNDIARRTFLFELSCFVGDWDRAERQLDVIGHQSTQAELGVMVYRANIKAERERQRLFKEGVQPHFLREPPKYVDFYLEAINQAREGRWAEARQTLDRGEDERPAISGKLGDREFQDFRDYDDFVAPVLELIVKDRYVWLPFDQIARLEISRPKQLRDLLWATARVVALDGTIGEVYVPCLYAGSSENDNNQIKLGRATDSEQLGADVFRAVGLRLFMVDGEDTAIFELGAAEFTEKTETAAQSVS